MKTSRAVRGGRDNPPYDSGHAFAVVRCERCGEFYEADKPHICRKRNSWPFWFDDEGSGV